MTNNGTEKLKYVFYNTSNGEWTEDPSFGTVTQAMSIDGVQWTFNDPVFSPESYKVINKENHKSGSGSESKDDTKEIQDRFELLDFN
jgi:hypothetical protein